MPGPGSDRSRSQVVVPCQVVQEGAEAGPVRLGVTQRVGRPGIVERCQLEGVLSRAPSQVKLLADRCEELAQRAQRGVDLLVLDATDRRE